MSAHLRGLLAALLLLPLAACGDDSTGPRRLTGADVQGVFEVCELRFTPTASFLSPVDVRTAAFELSREADRPRFFVNRNGTFELEFTPKGQFADVELPGTFTTGVRDVTFTFGTGATSPASLLIPSPLRLQFEEATRTLTATNLGPFRVPREDFGRLAGLTPQERNQLQPLIEGRLNARLAPSCP